MKSIQAILVLVFTFSLLGCNQSTPKTTIGIIEPLEHTAMDKIVAGFTETLKGMTTKPINIKVENAQNDANLQRAIIQKMHDTDYAIIVPIGTGATQMTLAMVHDKPVVSLAASLSEADRKKLKVCNTVVVHDEIPEEKSIQFIHTVYPTLTKLTLVHSAADKVFPEVK